MNITLAIPTGKKYKQRIKQELSTSNNIKSKKYKQSIQQGLRKILDNYQERKVYLWNGKKLEIFDYPLKEFIYHCGKDFMCPEIPKDNTYLMVLMDSNNLTLGLLQGKRIIKLESKKSNVPGKQDSGGQSQRRFEREREHCLVIWMKNVADKINDIYYNKKINLS